MRQEKKEEREQKEFRNKITDAATAKVKVKVRLLEVVRRVEDLNIKRLREIQEKWMRPEKKEEREHKMSRTRVSRTALDDLRRRLGTQVEVAIRENEVQEE